MSVHRNLHNNPLDAIVFAIKKLSSFGTKINDFSGRFLIFSDLAKGVWTFFIYVTENIFGLREEKTLAEFVGNTIASGSRTTSVQFFEKFKGEEER